jgi:ER-bound oxygenase mpaB/B'/Rubber oxygenase, catalytic domain
MPLSSNPASWTESQLEQLRQTGDPPADEMIARVFADRGVAGVNQVLTHFLDNRDDNAPISELPAYVSEFLSTTAALPGWADQNKLATAEELFLDQGPLVLLALTCASLPECYINGDEAEVLGVTNRLKGRRAYRRIKETAQLIVDVLAQGAFTSQARAGIVATQRVRILHAGMRHLISGSKPFEALPSDDPLLIQLAEHGHRTAGVPINQEELAYTLCTFSYVVLRSLAILRVGTSKDKQDAYVHSWAVAGHLIGIQDNLIPLDFAEVEALFTRLKTNQFRATKEGAVLAHSLRAFMAEVLGFPWVGRQAATFLMRTLLDERTTISLGIGRLSLLDRIVVLLLRLVVRNVEQLQKDVGRTDLRPLLQWAEERVVDGLSAMPPAWQGRLFAIPPNIKSHWSMRRRR